MKIELNDKRGNRGRHHINILIAPDGNFIKFEGESIRPHLRVTRTDYTKMGKWSHNTWTCEVYGNAQVFVFSQDWETGEWFPVSTWDEAVKHFRAHIQPCGCSVLEATDEQIVRGIHAIFPKSAASIDASEAEWQVGIANSSADIELMKLEIRIFERENGFQACALDSMGYGESPLQAIKNLIQFWDENQIEAVIPASQKGGLSC